MSTSCGYHARARVYITHKYFMEYSIKVSRYRILATRRGNPLLASIQYGRSSIQYGDPSIQYRDMGPSIQYMDPSIQYGD